VQLEAPLDPPPTCEGRDTSLKISISFLVDRFIVFYQLRRRGRECTGLAAVALAVRTRRLVSPLWDFGTNLMSS
jgi:hypothetical protein